MEVEGRRPLARRHPPEDLLRTAERLLATNGIDMVSLRQIAVEVGCRNPSVVQYHFGSRGGLLRAIVEYRLPSINRRRLQLLERLHEADRDDDVRGLVEAMARPLLELDPESYYVEFLARLQTRADFEEAFLSAGGLISGIQLLRERLEAALHFLPTAVLQNRLWMAGDLLVTSIANRRSRTAAGIGNPLRDELFAEDLFNVMVGIFCAQHDV
jgi:AcrR family transcriptional regulator